MLNEFFRTAYEDIKKSGKKSKKFKSFPDFIEGMTKEMKVKIYEPGDYLCHHLEKGNEMFFIYRGKVGVFTFITPEEVEKTRLELKKIAQKLIEGSERKFTYEMIKHHLDFP